MTAPHINDILREMIVSALKEETVESSDTHPVDDEGLLIRWSLGNISDEQHQGIIDHLADCTYCREELVAMLDAGVLVLPGYSPEQEPELEPELAIGSHAANFGDRPSGGAYSRKVKTMAKYGITAILAVASSLLLCVMLFPPNGQGLDWQLALARDELEMGDPESAFERLDLLLTKSSSQMDSQLRQEAETLIEESGYQLAQSRLADLRFQDVLTAERRLAEHGVQTSRLLSSSISAQREIPNENMLAMNETLLDYGDMIGGTPPVVKSGNPPTIAKQERLIASYTDAVDRYPDDVRLRTNWGFLLLELRCFPTARQQFRIATETDPRYAAAWVGLGLTCYQQAELNVALQHFEQAVLQDEQLLAAQLNLAICLARTAERSDSTTPQERSALLKEAEGHFRKALQLTDDESLRRQILEQLGE